MPYDSLVSTLALTHCDPPLKNPGYSPVDMGDMSLDKVWCFWPHCPKQSIKFYSAAVLNGVRNCPKQGMVT